MKFEKYLNYFKDDLTVRNFSERTVFSYAHEIKKFHIHLVRRNIQGLPAFLRLQKTQLLTL